MLPRSLVVPAGASSSDTAEMIPAVVTAVTSASARSSMSDEQLGYRYIDHGDTGSGKPMYEARPPPFPPWTSRWAVIITRPR